MALKIRKARLSDGADLADIHARSWEAAYAGIIPEEAIRERNAGRLDTWNKTLSGEHTYYIAEADDAPVGLMGIHPCRDDDLTDAGEIGAIYLRPGFWDKGYGREMMRFGLRMLKAQGFSVITVWVLEENARARRFYEQCGFAFDGTKKEIIIGKPLIEVRYRADIGTVRTCGGEAST